MTSREAQQAAFNKWYDSIYKGIAYTLKDDMEAAWQAGREALLAEIKARKPVAVAEELRSDGVYFLVGYGGLSDEDTPCHLYRLPEGEQ